jgi:tetratricopeptide (TPR) repeat protein
VANFERALEALGHLPETRKTLEQAIDLRFDLRTSLFPLADFDRIHACLLEADRLARALGDQRRLGWMSMYMCHNLWATGHPTEALTFGQSAQGIGNGLRDGQLQVAATLYLGVAYLGTGDFGRAEDLLRHVVQSLEGDPSRERFGLAAFPAVASRFYLGWALAERGALMDGITIGQEGVQIAEAVNHPYTSALAGWGLAIPYAVKGEFSRAIDLLERSLALTRDWTLTTVEPLVTEYLGYVSALSGRVTEGLQLLGQALEAFESSVRGLGAFHPLAIVQLGEVCVLAGRLDDARAFAGRAFTFARERGQRGYEAWTLRLLAEVASHGDPVAVETADGYYRQARVLAGELGMRPLVAHCHLGLGKLYGRTGDRQQAQEHLTTATAMYREMGMRFWLEQAEAELRELA